MAYIQKLPYEAEQSFLRLTHTPYSFLYHIIMLISAAITRCWVMREDLCSDLPESQVLVANASCSDLVITHWKKQWGKSWGIRKWIVAKNGAVDICILLVISIFHPSSRSITTLLHSVVSSVTRDLYVTIGWMNHQCTYTRSNCK